MITAEEARGLIEENRKTQYEQLVEEIDKEIIERAKKSGNYMCFNFNEFVFYVADKYFFFDDNTTDHIFFNCLKPELEKRGFRVDNSTYIVDTTSKDITDSLFFDWTKAKNTYVTVRW